MKTFLSATVIAASLFFFVPSRASADTLLIISSPASVTPASTFDVDVNIIGAVDLYDYELDLSFDPTVLAADSVSEGSFLDGGGATFFIPGTIDNIGGTVTFNADSLLGPPPGVTGDGTLLVFEFTALNAGTSALTIENEILQDSLGDITSDTTTAGSVTVETSGGGGGIPTVPEPSTLLLLLLGVVALFARAVTKTRTGLFASFRG
jgi:hypothetical protein